MPVKLIGNGGGLVYAPLGPTHQAIEDISIMRTLPNMTIIAPCDSIEMRELVKQSVNHQNPMYIRLARGGDKIITSNLETIKLGKAILKVQPKETFIYYHGSNDAASHRSFKKIRKRNEYQMWRYSLGKP